LPFVTPKENSTVNELFRKVSRRTAEVVGSSWSFITAILVIVVWGFTGPLFGFSDTWQLVINTGTTIVTFLMVFLIQNTQNRDGKVIQIKLDELIRVVEGARHGLVHLESFSDADLMHLEQQFQKLRSTYGDTAAEELLTVEQELLRHEPPTNP